MSLSIVAHKHARSKGFYDDAPAAPPIDRRGYDHLLGLLAMIGSEVGEAVDEVRMQRLVTTINKSGKPIGLPSELADIVLRCCDLAGFLGINLDAAVRQKMEYNASRTRRHGGKIA